MTKHDTYFDLGNMYHQSGDLSRAIEFFEMSYNAGNRSTEVLRLLAEGYKDANKLDQAIYFMDQLADRSEDRATIASIKYQIGELLTLTADAQKAASYFNAAVEYDPTYAQKIQTNDTARSAQLIEEPQTAASQSPVLAENTDGDDKDNIRLTMMLTVGIMHYRNGDLEDSEDALVNTITEAKKSENAWTEALAEHSLALVKTALGDIRGAIDAYLRAAELAPNQINPWNKVGALYEDLDQVDEAFEAYHRSLGQNPEDPESWNGIGDLLTRDGKFDEAIACYQLGNVFDRNSYGTDGIKVYEKALDYYKQMIATMKKPTVAKELDQTQPTMVANPEPELFTPSPVEPEPVSLDEVEVTVEVAPEPLIPMPMGLDAQPSTPPVAVPKVEAKIDDPEDVGATIRRFEMTVKENPFNDRAWDSLGNLYKQNNMIDKAIFAYENAVGIQPMKKIYHYQLGSLYAVDGNYQSAISEMNKVLENEPRSVYAHCALANYYRRLDKPQQASEHINIAAPYMKNEKEYDRACFESVRGNTDLAISYLGAALEKNQVTLDVVENDLDLDFIRDDPQYGALIQEARRIEAFV